MTRYVCRSNKDAYRTVEWPEDFVFPPRVGDYVEAKKSPHTAKVVSITHSTSRADFLPIVIVELS